MSSERLRVTLARAPRAVAIRADAGGERALDRLLACWIAEREGMARSSGRHDGEREALAGAAGALSAAAERLDAARAEAAGELARSAVELAVEIAGALVRSEIAANRHDLEQMVRETLALGGAGRGGACVVHLNPADAERVHGLSFRAGTQIESDGEVHRGEVRVLTPQGLLVRDPTSALADIAERLAAEPDVLTSGAPLA